MWYKILQSQKVVPVSKPKSQTLDKCVIQFQAIKPLMNQHLIPQTIAEFQFSFEKPEVSYKSLIFSRLKKNGMC